MKLKYHKKIVKITQPFDDFFGHKGLLVLESEPQMRNLHFYKYNTGERELRRVPLPYIYFVIRYNFCEFRQRYVYPGLNGNGLRVYGSLKPLNSFKEKVFLLPTDSERLGVVCTEHNYDGKEFPNYFELANFVVGLWWNSEHNIVRDPFFPSHWRKKKLEDLENGNWKYIHNNLFEAMLHVSSFQEEEKQLRNKKFRDFQWPPRKFVRKKNEIKI